MKFNYRKLDARTRILMEAEIDTAEKSKNLYFSTRFNTVGNQGWVSWLRSAAKRHDEHWLAYQLEIAVAMKDFETRKKPKGGYAIAHVPDTAAETFADGQFNRFYVAAICRRTLEDKNTHVQIYRAKHRGEPRVESRALEGTSVGADGLLLEMRNKDLSLTCKLLKPNSGLSVDY